VKLRDVVIDYTESVRVMPTLLVGLIHLVMVMFTVIMFRAWPGVIIAAGIFVLAYILGRLVKLVTRPIYQHTDQNNSFAADL
jgi:hypothetical protein